MSLNLIGEYLNGIMLFEPSIYRDDRGSFIEGYRLNDLHKFGITDEFVQENISISKQGVVRGLHYQLDPPQGKFLQVILGKAKFIEIDIRQNSETYGEYAEFYLNDKNNYLLWIPPGFANGFSCLSDRVIVNYKVTQYWNPRSEGIILYNDPAMDLNWEIINPIISERDMKGKIFSQIIPFSM